jgi:succinylglutamate desuccinylase
MQVIQSTTPIFITMVCCLHGDETFGLKVFNFYQPKLKNLPGLRLILANEEALAQNKRFIDEDLNRCFPGAANGNTEARLAYRLLPHIQETEIVLDIHTTTSDIEVTPIVTSLNARVRQVINACGSTEVCLMEPPIAGKSLIGQVGAGVSLEFGQDYAQLSGMEYVESMIEVLLHHTSRLPKARKIFSVSHTIPLEISLPNDAKNFTFIPELGGYPFLLGEKSYTTHQGFAADSHSTITC